MSETVALPSSPPPSGPPPQTPTLVELFVAFALISLCGFGGVLAWSRRMLVEERKLDLFAGDQLKPEYKATNPQAVVPTLFDGDAKLLGLVQLKTLIAGTPTATPSAALVPADIVREFLKANGVTTANGSSDPKASIVRVICVRK